MPVNDSTADSKKAEWATPELRDLDVSRNTMAGGGPKMLPESIFYSPS